MPKEDDPIANRIETLQALFKIERIQHMLAQAITMDKSKEEDLRSAMDSLSSHTKKMFDRLGEDIDGK